MSNLPSSARYVQTESVQTRAPVGENVMQTMGGSINYLLDNVTSLTNINMKSTLLTSSSGTFTVPDGVTMLLVVGCGGGAGGYGGDSYDAGPVYHVGGHGGAAAPVTSYNLSVVPGQVISYTVGGGGIGGGFGSGIGNNGASSTFGTLTFIGGYNFIQPAGLYSNNASINGFRGQSCYGLGGAGGTYIPATPGGAAPANSGAGGGGGPATSVPGGAGGSGRITVFWVSI